MRNITDIFNFLKNNPLFALVPIFFISLILLKPFRKMIVYFAKNIIPLAFLVFLNFLCPLFGYTISLNVFSIMAALLLGLPGISLALFLSVML